MASKAYVVFSERPVRGGNVVVRTLASVVSSRADADRLCAMFGDRLSAPELAHGVRYTYATAAEAKRLHIKV